MWHADAKVGHTKAEDSGDFSYPTCNEWENTGTNAQIQLFADDLPEAWYVDPTVIPPKETKAGEGRCDTPSADQHYEVRAL